MLIIDILEGELRSFKQHKKCHHIKYYVLVLAVCKTQISNTVLEGCTLFIDLYHQIPFLIPFSVVDFMFHFCNMLMSFALYLVLPVYIPA